MATYLLLILLAQRSPQTADRPMSFQEQFHSPCKFGKYLEVPTVTISTILHFLSREECIYGDGAQVLAVKDLPKTATEDEGKQQWVLHSYLSLHADRKIHPVQLYLSAFWRRCYE